MRKSIIKFALCGGMLAGMLASCTGDYMDYNTNPYEATKDQMDRDAYAIRSALTGMQGYVIPTDVNLNQFLECLRGGALRRLSGRIYFRFQYPFLLLVPISGLGGKII
jgi:hypothetical protein